LSAEKSRTFNGFWDQIEATFVKENILGSEFSFSTKTDMTVSIDYIPKIQAKKFRLMGAIRYFKAWCRAGNNN
jgi:hypothetical protein